MWRASAWKSARKRLEIGAQAPDKAKRLGRLTMAYSFTEKKRIRKNFGKRPSILGTPYLLAIQLDSYRRFFQGGGGETHSEGNSLRDGIYRGCPHPHHSGNCKLRHEKLRLGVGGLA